MSSRGSKTDPGLTTWAPCLAQPIYPCEAIPEFPKFFYKALADENTLHLVWKGGKKISQRIVRCTCHDLPVFIPCHRPVKSVLRHLTTDTPSNEVNKIIMRKNERGPSLLLIMLDTDYTFGRVHLQRPWTYVEECWISCPFLTPRLCLLRNSIPREIYKQVHNTASSSTWSA